MEPKLHPTQAPVSTLRKVGIYLLIAVNIENYNHKLNIVYICTQIKAALRGRNMFTYHDYILKLFRNPDPCDNYCRNGATNCTNDLHNNPKCQCPPQYKGDACEYLIRKPILLHLWFILHFFSNINMLIIYSCFLYNTILTLDNTLLTDYVMREDALCDSLSN